MNGTANRHWLILFLRLAILASGIAVAGLCIVLAPLIFDVKSEFPNAPGAVYWVLATIYLTAIPYFLGLYKAWAILQLIDTGKVFTFSVVRKLWVIARCAVLICALYVITLPAFYMWADTTDAPGILVIGIMLTGIFAVVATITLLVRELLHEAVTNTQHTHQ